jgi:anti-sigma regulatory factor (Ser/Thr protein kinase)
MKIRISSDPRLLQILRGVVRYRAEVAGFSVSEAEGLAMAVDEAASNVMRHTYGGKRGGMLDLEICLDADRMEFCLEDVGPKVSPETLRPRALDEVRPGGLGTYFIRCFVDEWSYDEGFSGGNRLKLVKYRRREGPAHDESPSSDRG